MSQAETFVFMPIGGKATRALAVTNDLIPKHLISVGEETILDIICTRLIEQGFSRFVFCIGHHGEKIKDHVSNALWRAGVEVLFSKEDSPLGVDGAVSNAIQRLNLSGTGIIIPGDMMFPWDEIRQLDDFHSTSGNGVTISMTDLINERSGDVGKMIVEDSGRRRLTIVYARDEEVPNAPEGFRALTCAAATAINLDYYEKMCEIYQSQDQVDSANPYSMRDQVAPWAVSTGKFEIGTYELKGEILDLGTPDNIDYFKKNWRLYA